MTHFSEKLSDKTVENLLKTHVLSNKVKYRRDREASEGKSGTVSLFASVAEPVARDKDGSVIWGTDNYRGQGKDCGFHGKITKNTLKLIKKRTEKSKEEQSRRVKEKAEVFTPSWVTNVQNNLIDDETLYPGAFNKTVGSLPKTWEPTLEKIRFTDTYTWQHYVAEKRIEICCGEGPYLMSPYDAVTGDPIPVRNDDGAFQRVGLLDRKLRVVSENVDEENWVACALVALKTIFGYEWQGDNLVLARLNLINTFSDYHVDKLGVDPSDELIEEVAEIASWQLWQMDGLKGVVPESCTATCQACETGNKGKNKYNHDGIVPVISFAKEKKPFEDFMQEWLKQD